MDRGMASRRPATAAGDFVGMIHDADVDLPAAYHRTLILRVTLEAQVHVALDKHLGIHRTMRNMTGDAALTHGIVLVHTRPGLLTMTSRAGFVQSRHRQPGACGFHDVRAMRVMALHAVQFSLQDWMMMWQAQLSVGLEMTGQARGGVIAGIDDELPPPAATGNMPAAWSMTRFAPGLAFHCGVTHMHPGMGARRKTA